MLASLAIAAATISRTRRLFCACLRTTASFSASAGGPPAESSASMAAEGTGNE